MNSNTAATFNGISFLESTPQSDRNSHFKNLVEQYASEVKIDGVNISPYSEDTVPFFSALSFLDQKNVIKNLTSELEVFSELRNEGISLKDSPRFIWRILKKLQLTPKGDIFDKIGKEDVVSIYLTNQKQAFQNLRFLELVSLTLEQIYCNPWYTYSRRDPEIEKQVYDVSSKLLSGQIDETLEPGVIEHEAWEVDTVGLARLMIKVKYISPLKDAHVVTGMLVINHCTPIGGSMNGYSK